MRVRTLPDDLQVFIFDMLELAGWSGDFDALDLPVVRLPVAAFPVEPLFTDDRDEEYLDDMRHTDANDLPPIVVCGRKWLDGRHRVHLAREREQATIAAFDLAAVINPRRVMTTDVIALLKR